MYHGHGSQLTHETVISAMENVVIIIGLPPYTSHAIQPLGVGLLKPLKTKWRNKMQFFRETRMKLADKAIINTIKTANGSQQKQIPGEEFL